MKKTLALLIALVIALAACSGSESDASTAAADSTPAITVGDREVSYEEFSGWVRLVEEFGSDGSEVVEVDAARSRSLAQSAIFALVRLEGLESIDVDPLEGDLREFAAASLLGDTAGHPSEFVAQYGEGSPGYELMLSIIAIDFMGADSPESMGEVDPALFTELIATAMLDEERIGTWMPDPNGAFSGIVTAPPGS